MPRQDEQVRYDRQRPGSICKRLRLIALLGCQLVSLGGCSVLNHVQKLPTDREIVRDQLIVHADFHLPKRHRILDDLVARRNDISQQLDIPTSDEPIHIYLFQDQSDYQKYMKRQHPAFPDRRAFFVKNDTTLMVFAYWGDRIAEDLRHEVTHGYLHSVIPNIPLWMDEGLAEYYETPRGSSGVSPFHVQLLADSFRKSQWYPNLRRLETLEIASDLTQLDYAEAWLWVHFLLSTDAQTNSLLCGSLADLRETGSCRFIAPQIESYLPDWDQQLILHLKSLADGG